jgi:hypothetical protein
MLNESTSIKGESSTPFAGAKNYLKKWQLKQVQKKLPLQAKNQPPVQLKQSRKLRSRQ